MLDDVHTQLITQRIIPFLQNLPRKKNETKGETKYIKTIFMLNLSIYQLR